MTGMYARILAAFLMGIVKQAQMQLPALTVQLSSAWEKGKPYELMTMTARGLFELRLLVGVEDDVECITVKMHLKYTRDTEQLKMEACLVQLFKKADSANINDNNRAVIILSYLLGLGWLDFDLDELVNIIQVNWEHSRPFSVSRHSHGADYYMSIEPPNKNKFVQAHIMVNSVVTHPGNLMTSYMANLLN